MLYRNHLEVTNTKSLGSQLCAIVSWATPRPCPLSSAILLTQFHLSHTFYTQVQCFLVALSNAPFPLLSTTAWYPLAVALQAPRATTSHQSS